MSTVDFWSGILTQVGSILTTVAMLISAVASVVVAVRQHLQIQRNGAPVAPPGPPGS